MITEPEADVLVSLRTMQTGALESVARLWTDRTDRTDRARPTDVAAGLVVLATAVGAPLPLGLDTAPEADRTRWALRTSIEITGTLAEAGRRVAASAGQAGWSCAAEVADAVSTTAQVLRMLAELELTATPGP